MGSDGRVPVLKKTGSAPKDRISVGLSSLGGRSVVVKGCRAPQEADHMCTIDERIDTELTTSILQVEFLATMGWAVRADLSTAH